MPEDVWVRCPRCDGRGTVRYQDPTAHGDTDTVLCPLCHGNEFQRVRGVPWPTAGWLVEDDLHEYMTAGDW